jgi:hypothetical protein
MATLGKVNVGALRVTVFQMRRSISKMKVTVSKMRRSISEEVGLLSSRVFFFYMRPKATHQHQ